MVKSVEEHSLAYILDKDWLLKTTSAETPFLLGDNPVVMSNTITVIDTQTRRATDTNTAGTTQVDRYRLHADSPRHKHQLASPTQACRDTHFRPT
jgi:hypothetical protein